MTLSCEVKPEVEHRGILVIDDIHWINSMHGIWPW
jgi:hypothetical protein